jgi:hypothetical protein
LLLYSGFRFVFEAAWLFLVMAGLGLRGPARTQETIDGRF